MKKRITSAIALIIFSIALIITAFISEDRNTDVEGGLKTGLAISTSVKASTDATTDKDGANATTITVVAVTVDETGKVVSCEIDVLDATVSFNTSGLITSDLTADCLTKSEIGDKYGMKEYSSIQKEWYEQIDAFEDYCIGKTSDQILGITVSEETGLPSDATLAAGCTMHPAQFQYVVAEAIESATVTGAKDTDKLGLAISASVKDSKDASADEDGLATVLATVAVTTVDASGKVTSAVIDAVQTDISFDTTGKITTDLTKEILTKNEKKDTYGMKEYSSIQKDWYEQAAHFASYSVGKTADDLYGITVTEGTTLATDTTLSAGCTMHPANFQYVVAEAIQNAK